MSSTSALREPLLIGNTTLRNRILMSSLTRSRSAPADVPTVLNVQYYAQRARGGAGLILTEGTLVSPQGTEWRYAPGIYSIKHAEAWGKVVDAAHEVEGAKIFCQLWHVGRLAHPGMPQQQGRPVEAPSAIAAKGGKFRDLNNSPYVAPLAPIADPWLLVEEFRRGASFAKMAGFDGVELHGANGYLLAQFFDPNANQRDDEWGGSLDNRARFVLECLKAVIGVFGKENVGIKLNPAGGLGDVGVPASQAVEEFSYLIKEILKLEIGFINLVRLIPVENSLFAHISPTTANIDVPAIFGHPIKNPNSATKLFLNGGFTAEEAERMVAEGVADAVVFGRPWINNPDFAQRALDGSSMNEQLGFPLDHKTFYAGHDPDLVHGYTDYPTFEEAQMHAEN